MVAARALLAVLLAGPCLADAPRLALPIACTLGQDCYIQNHVDHDPGPAMSDFACGKLGYDGHDGTDFALPTTAAMLAGVDVLAAAAGTVRGMRDEMPDIAQGTPGAPDVTDRECGNGIAITHADGWETQYCHLMRGSIRVRPGDTVMAGTVIGQVGLSGQTEFPHVHLTVRQGAAEVDPFDPDGTITCGAPSGETLWATPIPYMSGGPLTAGWSTVVPAYGDVRAGTADQPINRDSPALVLFGLFFGGHAGDRISISIDGPQGEVLVHEEALDRDQALFFRAAGVRMPVGGWPAGQYDGTVRLIRPGRLFDQTVTLTIP